MNVIDSSEPLVPEGEEQQVPPAKTYCLINYKTTDERIEKLFDWELQQRINAGYIIVEYRTLHDYRIDKVAKADKRRRKTQLQKLRRQLGAAYIKPPRDKR